LDFEEEMDEGTFWTYGLGARNYGSIWPDRTPQPEMWQMKKSAQPLSFRLLDADQGTVEVWNRSRFLNASHYVTTWTLTADADVVAFGELPLDVAPMDRKIVRIRLPHPQAVPGKEYRLTVSSVLAEDEMWAPKGYEVSWDQFELKAWNIPGVHQAVSGKVGLSEKNDSYVISGEGFSYTFSAVTGELVSAVVRGKEMMARPLKLNVWRAPIANEVDGWGGGSAGRVNAPGYSAVGHTSQILAAHYYAAGLDRMASHPIQVTAREAGDGVVVEVRTLALLGSEEKQLDAYISGRSYSGFEEAYRWTVAGDGTLTLHHKVNPQGTMPAWLPRLGLTLMLDKSLKQVEWHGRGPQASYPDRKSGYRLGIWHTDVASMYEPYLMPQDYGLRTDTRWVRMTDAFGCGLEFSMDQPFAFNAYDCTTDNLTKAVYQFDLQRGGDITLNLDYATSGVGDTARGILGAYRAYPTAYERTICIRPVK
jgi:beta-galactosidase